MMNKFLLTLLSCAFASSSFAQQPLPLTTKDYQQAESFMGYNTQKFIDHSAVSANWIPGDRFWYRTLTPGGSEFILVDAGKGTRGAAFDPQNNTLEKDTSMQAGNTQRPGGFRNRSNEVLSPDGSRAAFIKDYNLWV